MPADRRPAQAPDPIVGELREQRRRRRMQLREVAEMLGISTSTLQAYEHGRRRPSLDMLRRWAAIFDLQPGLIPAPPPDTGGNTP